MSDEDQYSFEDFAKDIGRSFARIVEILGDPVSDPLAVITLLRELGWDVDYDTVINGINIPLLEVGQQIEGLISGSGSIDIAGLLSSGGNLDRAADTFIDDIGIAGDAQMLADMRAQLPRQLLDYALIEFVSEEFPLLFGILAAGGIAQVRYEEPAESYKLPHFSRTMRWEVLKKCLADPSRYFEYAYGWGLDDFDGEVLFDGLDLLLSELNIDVSRESVSDNPLAVNESVAEPIRLAILEHENVELGLECYVTELAGGGNGLAISPYAIGGVDLAIPIAEVVNLRLQAGAVLDRDLGFRLSPTDGVQAFSDVGLESLNGTARLAIEVVPQQVLARIGNPEGTRFDLATLTAGVNAAVEDGAPEIGVELMLGGAGVHVNTEGADGFLVEIIGPVKLDAELDLTMGWSSGLGMYLQSSGAIEIEIPLHKEAGPLLFDSVWLSLALDTEGMKSSVGISLSVTLGPISAAINRLGANLQLEFGGEGEFGVRDVQYGFLPPTGAGLSVDAGGILGGGFLEFDFDNERYTGVLGLTFGEIGLTAIGLITTKLPGDKKGFSLLINIGVIFDPPIELFSGFTLTGVGGLIGINRSMDIEVLQRGIKNRTLDSILFPNPATVVANAAKIISDMRAVFPPTDGQFVIGPMIKIGWGYPNIITADIGVFIELPDPIRIVLMGQLEGVLPEERKPLVVIHLDVLGVLDFEKEQLTFQASLYDSEILKLKISGDSAFLFGWGNDPRFALSLGGFHPDFTPPPPPIVFADLKRLSIDISSGSDFQLSCRAYQALTPNSFQFGARVDLYASAAGAEVTGYLGFEALIYFSPFSFEVWIGAAVKIKYKGATLADVELSLTLSGPTPWNARGTASIKILFFDIDVGFEVTWGRREKARIPAEDPWPRLERALSANSNWGRALPRGRQMTEILREAGAEATEESDKLLIHPASRFEVRQNVVPLNTRLEKAGNAPVKRYDRFRITRATVNGQEVDLATVKDHFSRGQFESLTNEQKLSLPSFERMPAGISSTGLGRIRVDGAVEKKELKYESIIIKDDRTAERQDTSGTFDWAEARPLAAFVARKRALKRAGPRAQFAPTQPKPKVGLKEEAYCIVNAADLTLAGEPGLGDGDEALTRMSADRALRDHLESSPTDSGRYIVVPDYEVAA